MQEIGVTSTVADRTLIVRLTGEIDLATVDAAARELCLAAAKSPPHRLVVLDLTGVGFLSVAGVRIVHGFAGACAERGVETRVVVNPESIVRRIIDFRLMDPRLSMFESVYRALRD